MLSLLMEIPWEVGLEIVFVTTGVTLTIVYHAVWLYAFLKWGQYTSLGVNLIIRYRWADKLFEKIDVIAIQNLRNNIMLLVVNATVIVTVLAFLMPQLIRGDVIHVDGLDFTDSEPFRTLFRIKILIVFILLMLAFLAFTQAMKLSSHLGYLMNIANGDPELSQIHVEDEVCRLIRDSTVYYWIGMRFFYLSFPVILYLIGPTWYLVSEIFLILIFIFQMDFKYDAFSVMFAFQGYRNEKRERHQAKLNEQFAFFRTRSSTLSSKYNSTVPIDSVYNENTPLVAPRKSWNASAHPY